MPIVDSFLPASTRVIARNFGVELDFSSMSYALEGLHLHKGKRRTGLPTSYNRKSCAGAMDAILRRPIFRYGTVGRTKAKVKKQMEFLKKILEIDADTVKTPLKVVQVAGSKGKGSTCCFLQSILHEGFGLKTGLFTSPHLVSLTERFRINGTPVDEPLLLRHFWWCWDKLRSAGILFNHPYFPSFFAFFTLVALRLFLEEKVDIAILEVGIGGRLDATTGVIDYLVACGVSVLDYDHIAMLGSTLTQIGREKAGVMRCGVPAIAVSQRAEGLAALEHQAKAVGADFSVVKSLTEEVPRYEHVTLGIPGDFQKDNAALARALALVVVRQGHAPGVGKDLDQNLEDRIERGLRDTRWPGRCTTLRFPEPATVRARAGSAASAKELALVAERSDNAAFLFGVDGAHTPLSLERRGSWFRDQVVGRCGHLLRENAGGGADASQTGKPRLALVFNCGPERSPVELLKALAVGCLPEEFDHAVFCPADSKKTMSDAKAESLRQESELAVRRYFGDDESRDYDYETPLSRFGVELDQKISGAPLSAALRWSLLLANVWARLAEEATQNRKDIENSTSASARSRVTVTVCRCFSDAVRQLLDSRGDAPLVSLATGSLYLVGTVLNHGRKYGAEEIS